MRQNLLYHSFLLSVSPVWPTGTQLALNDAQRNIAIIASVLHKCCESRHCGRKMGVSRDASTWVTKDHRPRWWCPMPSHHTTHNLSLTACRLVVPPQKIARKNGKLCKMYEKIALKIYRWMTLKLTKFAKKLHARCMVVVYKSNPVSPLDGPEQN